MSGVAAARALTDDRGLVPAFVAGHSIGAFAAAVTAAVLTLAEAMSAACAETSCSRSARAVSGATAAVLGRELPRSLANHVGTSDDPVWIANINTADQIVLSGSTVALEAAR